MKNENQEKTALLFFYYIIKLLTSNRCFFRGCFSYTVATILFQPSSNWTFTSSLSLISICFFFLLKTFRPHLSPLFPPLFYSLPSHFSYFHFIQQRARFKGATCINGRVIQLGIIERISTLENCTVKRPFARTIRKKGAIKLSSQLNIITVQQQVAASLIIHCS